MFAATIAYEKDVGFGHLKGLKGLKSLKSLKVLKVLKGLKV